jgi:NTP pyrophosphatase (non-canonical NTP hydrolase)
MQQRNSFSDHDSLFTIHEFMNFEEYQSEASQTAHYPRRMSNLEYPTLGLAGEAGEVANIVKKIQRDHSGILNDEIRGKLKDELGDVLWYISACADELGITLTEIAEYNVNKLAKRHGR